MKDGKSDPAEFDALDKALPPGFWERIRMFEEAAYKVFGVQGSDADYKAILKPSPNRTDAKRDARDILMRIKFLEQHVREGQYEAALYNALDLGELGLRLRLRGEPEKRALIGKKNLKGSSDGGKARKETLFPKYQQVLSLGQEQILKCRRANPQAPITPNKLATLIHKHGKCGYSVRQITRIIKGYKEKLDM